MISLLASFSSTSIVGSSSNAPSAKPLMFYESEEAARTENLCEGYYPIA